MGIGHSYSCKNCGHTANIYLGVGTRNNEFYKEMKKTALIGKYGKRLQKIIQEDDSGVLNAENVIYICECGGWKVVTHISYSLCNNFQKTDTSLNTSKLCDNMKTLYDSRHFCPICYRKMHVLPDNNMSELTCPICGSQLDFLFCTIKWV